MSLLKKWKDVIDHPDLPKITDPYRRAALAVLLENQETESKKSEQVLLQESAPTNVSGNVDRYDPVLISLVRRMEPNLIAYDICGVQPMKLPTGLVFSLRAHYGTGATGPLSATEALFNEANTAWGGTGTHDVNVFPDLGATGPMGSAGTGMATSVGEGLSPKQMGFEIDKFTVTATTRTLASHYSIELAQDLKATHNLDADSELSKILQMELMAEQNREVLRTIYKIAKHGAQVGTTTKGGFDLDTDSDGRWSVERFKGLMYQLEREANAIARTTRRGKANFAVCSSDVASAFAMAGTLDYAPALKTDLKVDDTGNTFVGVLNGKTKIFIDPYFSSASSTWTDIMVPGYKGPNPYDAGLYYCPYVPLTPVRATNPLTFQPHIGFKTRYGLASHPLSGDGNNLAANSNFYFRRVMIANIL